jgi:hypothetical protein
VNEQARLVGVIELPVALTEFGTIAKRYPKGSTITQVGAHLWVYSKGERCFGCITCDDRDRDDFEQLTGDWRTPHMIICPECGCKRCPKASHHDNACTGSNEPGQEGSVYA